MNPLQYRARTGSDDPLIPGEGSQASQAERQPREEENRMKAGRDLRLLRDHGHIDTLPPRNRGEGVARARAYILVDPEIHAGWSA